MKLNIRPQTLCRTPVFSYKAKIEEVWNELKTYIEESSPAFFDIIKNYESSELKDLEPKIKFTLWKYFNRAKFRATPYGHFAAFSLVTVRKEEKPNEITIIEESISHRFPDWSAKENVNLSPAWLSKNANLLKANTTAYICGEDLRYVNFVEGVFELSEVSRQQLAMETLQFCHDKRKLSEVRDFLSVKASLDAHTIDDFIEQLIGLQLLFTDFHPNITGVDYFKRINSLISPSKEDYIIAERKIEDGQLNEKSLQVVTELANFLSKHIPLRENNALLDFRNLFVNKFESKEVSLLTALDPETGVNYLAFEQDTNQDNLIEDLKKAMVPITSSRRGTNPPMTDLLKFIVNQMAQENPVQLNGFNGPEVTPRNPVANTLSALLCFSDDLIILEQLGGCTANSLLGRFTRVSEEVFLLGKELVDIEQQANPDVLFFDIAYQAEKHVDNVNRRRSLYNYEMPILTWTESSNVLDLDDITIAVMGDELVLRSLKYGKRIVPRLASAYNYTRSDLTIFRFLSDLQHQNLHLGLSVNIDQLLPGLQHYPRIQYKNVVVSAAKWRVPDQLCIYKNYPLAELTEWLAGTGLQRFFKCGTGDQTLCFNREIEEDKIAFLSFCRHKTNLYIEEAFIPSNPVTKDKHHKPYLSEFIISLEHRQQLYKPLKAKVKPVQIGEQYPTSVFFPGGEWLYFEIYCHPTRGNNLLLENVRSLLTAVKKKIRNWFFIRYNHPANHIRLRLQLKPNTSGYEIMRLFSKLLEPQMLSGVVSDLQVKTYRRESDRYGVSRMPIVENFFCADSVFILSILKNGFQVNQLYALSLTLIEQVLSGAGFLLQQQLALAETMAASFAAEMNIGSEGFKKINQSFREFTNYGELAFIGARQKVDLLKTAAIFQEVLATSNGDEKTGLLTDLFHMHVNRLFYADQRMHEMVLYHFLTKALKTRIGRLKNQNLSNQL